MAIVKYSGLITEIKGSAGGTTFQGGRSGGTMKNKSKSGKGKFDIIKGTPGQSSRVHLKELADVVKRWTKLTNEQRANWSTLLGVYTFTNKFGERYNGTAFQIFTSMNLNKIALEGVGLDDCPTQTAALDPLFQVSDFSSAAGSLIKCNNIAAYGQKYIVEVTPPMAANRTSKAAKFIKLTNNQTCSAVDLTIYDWYLDFRGWVPQVGEICYFRIWTSIPNYPQKQFSTIYKVTFTA